MEIKPDPSSYVQNFEEFVEGIKLLRFLYCACPTLSTLKFPKNQRWGIYYAHKYLFEDNMTPHECIIKLLKEGAKFEFFSCVKDQFEKNKQHMSLMQRRHL